jgi:hypothetical protein
MRLRDYDSSIAPATVFGAWRLLASAKVQAAPTRIGLVVGIARRDQCRRSG